MSYKRMTASEKREAEIRRQQSIAARRVDIAEIKKISDKNRRRAAMAILDLPAFSDDRNWRRVLMASDDDIRDIINEDNAYNPDL